MNAPIFKGEWITNIGKSDRELWVSAGFIVWSPMPTEFATEEQLISAGILGVYANPMKPDAKFPVSWRESVGEKFIGE